MKPNTIQVINATLDSNPKNAGEPGTSSNKINIMLAIIPNKEMNFFTGATSCLVESITPFSDHLNK